MGQARGWNPQLTAELDRALVVVLSGHADGERLRRSELVGVLHRYGISVDRVAEVLAQAWLLDDDRVPALEFWCNDKLTELAPGIAADARGWVRTLAHGGPRSQFRKMGTVRRYLRCAHPVLVEWSTRYDHLREVTTGDIAAVADTLRGHPRRQTLIALRSLMRHCKKTGTIFADPAARIRTSLSVPRTVSHALTWAFSRHPHSPATIGMGMIGQRDVPADLPHVDPCPGLARAPDPI
jgi:hypothetical protein